MSDDRSDARISLANATEDDYGGNEGNVAEKDYEEAEEMSDNLNEAAVDEGEIAKPEDGN